MKSIILYITCLFSLVAIGQTPITDPHWQLIWNDEFNGTAINTSDWEVKHNCDFHGSPTIYTNRTDNVKVLGGNLILTVIPESYNCNPYPSSENGTCGYCDVYNHNYTSGWVETKQIRDIQYGFIEAKIKLPLAYGLHSAFWTWNGHNLSSGNPYNEIDIFEMLPGQNKGGVNYHTNYHMTTNVHVDTPRGFGVHAQVNFINDYTQWHTYAIEWSPSRIIWYVDGNIVRNSVNYFYNSDGIFNPNRIILGTGMTDYNNAVLNIAKEMRVDYVRMYQLNTNCNELINSCYYDFNSYNDKVKNSITIGSGGCTNVIPVGSNINLRASEFIKLEGNFNVPLGTSFYADVHENCNNTLPTACTNIYNRCQYNFQGYDNSVKKEILLGGNTCNITASNLTANVLLKATDKITLNSGVIIEPNNGKKVELSIVDCP